MISYSKILVPVDFSEPSKKAVTYGLTIAAQTNARLFLAHVVPDTTALSDAERDIRTLVPEKYAARFDVQNIVKIGSIDSELLGIVQDESIELVVMGTHGRRQPARWFIGSVTESILRKVPVPVLTVSHLKPETHSIELGLVSIKKILYATDLSDSSVIGMQYAIELARGTGARLTVAHVIDHTNMIIPGSTAAGYLEESRRKWAHVVRGKLNDLIQREKPPDVEMEPLLVEGKPYEQVLRIADGHSMDIIVLNLQSKGMLERAFLGSTAERVVRLAPVPVLSVPIALISNTSVTSPAPASRTISS